MDDGQKQPITYFVNGEPEEVMVDELKVRQILELADLKPVDKYKLKSLEPYKHDYGDNYDETVKLHEAQRFEARHNGPTQAS